MLKRNARTAQGTTDVSSRCSIDLAVIHRWGKIWGLAVASRTAQGEEKGRARHLTVRHWSFAVHAFLRAKGGNVEVPSLLISFRGRGEMLCGGGDKGEGVGGLEEGLGAVLQVGGGDGAVAGEELVWVGVVAEEGAGGDPADGEAVHA